MTDASYDPYCIGPWQICDGTQDCLTEEDEVDCGKGYFCTCDIS